jgi:hypothetical protein
MAPDVMSKFDFFIGEWDLDYRIPESIFSEAGTDSGTGKFKKILDGKYVFFEYSTESGGAANGIFAWDDKVKIYRYWWFESSGNFLTATCNFINDDTLAMNWHDTVLVQTFKKEGTDRIILNMQYPSEHGGHESVLEVIMTRKKTN